MAYLNLQVVSPHRRVFSDLKALSVTLPGAQGEVTLLPGHARLVSLVETGVITIVTEQNKILKAAVSSGFFEINQDQVILLAETLELPNEIDSTRARSAQQRAEKQLQEGELDEGQFRKHQLKLQRALVRQSLTEAS